jgi:hypothetical protein
MSRSKELFKLAAEMGLRGERQVLCRLRASICDLTLLPGRLSLCGDKQVRAAMVESNTPFKAQAGSHVPEAEVRD